MNFAIKHPNKHFTPPIIFILQSRSSKRERFMQSWLQGGPPPCTKQPIGNEERTRGEAACTKLTAEAKEYTADHHRAQNSQ
jgi:hypothetical protein